MSKTRPPRRAVSLRERKKAETWEAIASNALRLFIEQGFAETTLDQIADLADVHRQTVLRYFPTKEEIALAYQTRALDEFRAGLQDSQRSLPVLEFWREHIRRNARQVEARGGLTRAAFVSDAEPRLLGGMLRVEQAYQELLSEAFSREAGVDPELDVYSIVLAGLLVAGNYGVARRLRVTQARRNLEKTMLSVVDFAVTGFPKRAAVLGVTADYLIDQTETLKVEDAADNAFFRKYRKMPEETKDKIRRMVDLWCDDT